MELNPAEIRSLGLNIKDLAIAVMNQAFEDAMTNGIPKAFRTRDDWKENRRIAIKFLSHPSKDLTFWCEAADQNPTAVVEAMRRRFDEKGVEW